MIIAIVQARTGSTRLPNKLMKTIRGKTILELMLDRLKYCKLLDKVVIATTTNKKDSVIVDLCDKFSVESFRESEEDLLDRYYQCARQYNPDAVVRVTSDCPLIDPQWVDKLIRYYLKYKDEYDYFCNALEPTLPNGLDAELIPFEILKRTWKEAIKQYEREHVSPYIYRNPNLFRIFDLKNEIDYSHHRWTLDTPEDYELIKAIYNHFFEKGRQFFYLEDIIDFLNKNPHIYSINA